MRLDETGRKWFKQVKGAESVRNGFQWMKVDMKWMEMDDNG